MRARLMMAVAAVCLFVAFHSMAQAYSCNTQCYGYGNYRTCNTYFF
jgi:hypothetical protein